MNRDSLQKLEIVKAVVWFLVTTALLSVRNDLPVKAETSVALQLGAMCVLLMWAFQGITMMYWVIDLIRNPIGPNDRPTGLTVVGLLAGSFLLSFAQGNTTGLGLLVVFLGVNALFIGISWIFDRLIFRPNIKRKRTP